MATRICTGNGDCLTQCGHNRECNELYHKIEDMTCEFNCEPMKCPNYLICGDISPKWYFNCHWGTCLHCKFMFGKQKILAFSESECPVCLETKQCVTLLNCEHKECVDCFKRAWYGAKTQQPPFPIPELEEEYYDTSDEDRWRENHLVVKWWNDIEKWEDTTSEERSREKYLRCCPLCRK